SLWKAIKARFGGNEASKKMQKNGTEEVNIEEKEASNVKSGETEELDLETNQSTARQGTITPSNSSYGV
ncbi:hypothetical protein Tco_0513060, partial [Tanacetum coccineum]